MSTDEHCRTTIMPGGIVQMKQNQTAPHNFSLEQYSLYNEEIERFFVNNYITKKNYPRGKSIDDTRSSTVSYVHKGYLKLYAINSSGDEMFYGFVPQYSVMLRTPGAESLGKYSVANTEVEMLFVSLTDYLLFLQSAPQLILHQIHEPYYRRNFNDLPHCEALNQPARVKVYVFLRYVAMRFGKPAALDPNTVVISNAPTTKDIAHYNDIHPNNVVTFLNELKRQGIIIKDKDRLTIQDMGLLEAEIERLKK